MTVNELLEQTDLFLLDLDGTVYLSEQPIGDMIRTLARLRGMGKKIGYLTNNSSKTVAEYERSLKSIGIWGEGDRVFTPGVAAAELLKTDHCGKRVHVLGTDGMKAYLSQEGIVLSDTDPEVCLLAYDTAVTFEKLKRFNEFLQQGLPYLATHADAVCPTSGLPMPDVGSFIAFFGCASGREPDVVCGKPHPPLWRCVQKAYGLAPERVCMAGDRLYTDIRFGNRNGLRTVLVLTGDATAESAAVSEDKPDLILQDFNGILG
ncbi:MAG: HAD-IIA family hydrolase [Clostridia bacterium]|nr:HAD-IIA family hydrolase [Clostridia bacterium]